MKAGYLRSVALLLTGAPIALSWCAAVKSEFGHSGGIAGYYADAALPGATKELQFYRATVAYALFSTLGSRLATGPDQIFSTLRYMVAVRNDLDGLAGHLWPSDTMIVTTTAATATAAATTTTTPGIATIPCKRRGQTDCVGYRATFEYELPTLEGNLYKLAVSALPIQALTKVAGDLATQNWIGAVRTLVGTGGELVAGVHHMGAAWRSEREIFARLIITEPGQGDTVQEAVEDIDKLKGPDENETRKRYRLGIDSKNNLGAGTGGIDAVYWMVRQSCRRMLARLTDGDIKGHLSFVLTAGELLLTGSDTEKMRDAACASFKLRPLARP